MAVKPPMGTGRVRLVVIGEDGSVDLQPCGGTHVQAHRRDRPGRRHQDREEGQAEPPHPRRRSPEPAARGRDKHRERKRMADAAQKWLVETDWLASHLDTPGLVVLDGSMHLPTAKRDAKAEYLAEHIPGALFFDIDDIADEKSPLPHMLPLRDQVRQPHEEDGHRRRHARRRLRQRGPLLGGAGVVDVPRHGPRAGARAQRRPQEMEGRGRARSRTASRAGAPSATSPPRSTPAWCATSATSRR